MADYIFPHGKSVQQVYDDRAVPWDMPPPEELRCCFYSLDYGELWIIDWDWVFNGLIFPKGGNIEFIRRSSLGEASDKKAA